MVDEMADADFARRLQSEEEEIAALHRAHQAELLEASAAYALELAGATRDPWEDPDAKAEEMNPRSATPTILEGILEKKPVSGIGFVFERNLNLGGGWRHRCMLLQRDRIVWHHNTEDDAELTYQSLHFDPTTTKVRAGGDSGDDIDRCLTIENGDQTLVMRAASEGERDMWLRAVGRILEKLKASTFDDLVQQAAQRLETQPTASARRLAAAREGVGLLLARFYSSCAVSPAAAESFVEPWHEERAALASALTACLLTRQAEALIRMGASEPQVHGAAWNGMMPRVTLTPEEKRELQLFPWQPEVALSIEQATWLLMQQMSRGDGCSHVAAFFDHVLGVSRPFGYSSLQPRAAALGPLQGTGLEFVGVGVPPVAGELAAGAPSEPPVRWAQYCTEVHSTFLRRVLELAMRLPADLAALLEPLSEHYHVLPTSVECGAPSVLAAGRTRCQVLRRMHGSKTKPILFEIIASCERITSCELGSGGAHEGAEEARERAARLWVESYFGPETRSYGFGPPVQLAMFGPTVGSGAAPELADLADRGAPPAAAPMTAPIDPPSAAAPAPTPLAPTPLWGKGTANGIPPAPPRPRLPSVPVDVPTGLAPRWSGSLRDGARDDARDDARVGTVTHSLEGAVVSAIGPPSASPPTSSSPPGHVRKYPSGKEAAMAALAAARAGEAPLIAPPMFFTESYSSGKEAARAALAAAQAGEAPLVAIPWECGPSTDAALDQVWPEALVCGTAALLACADDWRSAAEVATADGRGEAAEAAALLLWGKHTVGKAHCGESTPTGEAAEAAAVAREDARVKEASGLEAATLALANALAAALDPHAAPCGESTLPMDLHAAPLPALGPAVEAPIAALGSAVEASLIRASSFFRMLTDSAAGGEVTATAAQDGAEASVSTNATVEKATGSGMSAAMSSGDAHHSQPTIHSQPFTATGSSMSSGDAQTRATEAKLDALVALVPTTTLTTTLAGAGSQGAMKEEAEAQAAVPQGSLQAASPPPPLMPTASSTRALTRALTVMPVSRSQQARHQLARAGLTGAPVRYFFKMGDDLRQDQATMLLLREMNAIWADAGAPCFTCTYDIFPTSERTGFIEALSNAIAVKDVESFTYSRELHDSAVGAFTAGFVLGLADRHQDNMLLCGPNRELFAHIDFGYVAGMRPWFDANLLPIPERFKNCLTAAGKWSAFVNDMGFAFAVLQQRRSELCTVAMTLSEQLATVGYPAYIEKTLTSNTIESVRAQVEAAVGDIARRFKNLHHKLQH